MSFDTVDFDNFLLSDHVRYDRFYQSDLIVSDNINLIGT
jgi:hypothetical protein